MAWSTPSVRATGDIITAAIWNQDIKDNTRYLKGMDGVPTIQNGLLIDNSLGTEYLQFPALTTAQRNALTAVNGMRIYNSTLTVFERYENGAWVQDNDLADMSIASIAQGDIFYRGASVIERLAAGTSGQYLKTQGAGANPTWAAGVTPFSLLKANSGTSTTSAAHNLDTVAISGLAAGDMLLIVGNVAQITQTGTTFQLRNDTDGVSLRGDLLTSTNLGVGAFGIFTCWVSLGQADTLNVITQLIGTQGGTTSLSSTKATVTTAWTGAWTLALYSDGQTSGGTHQWRWTVLKMAA